MLIVSDMQKMGVTSFVSEIKCVRVILKNWRT